jgi:hypothetical protein
MKKILLLITTIVLSQASYTYDYSGMQCGTKHKCSQMTTCKEAYFYLEKCGIKRLDRDKNGIPCERICR